MTLAKKIQYKFIPYIFKMSVAMRWYWMTSFLLVKTALHFQGDNPEYTVLALRRSIFTDDLGAMAQYSGRIHYIVIEREYVRFILFHYLTKSEREELTSFNYHFSDISEKLEKKYYEYLKKMIPHLRRMVNFQAVLTCNFDYVEQQEFARWCRNNHVPFIVLLKEGLSTAGKQTKWIQTCSNLKFLGDTLLVYNESIRKAVLEHKVEGVNPERVHVVGIPRMDAYFREASKDETMRQVVFFSFYPQYQFEKASIDNERRKEQGEKRCEDFHKMVMEFASLHPEIRVVIKTKKAKFYLDYVREIFDKHFKRPIDNLAITNQGDPIKLVLESCAVIGLNSTTLIEALAADRVVITPYVSDIKAGNMIDIYADYPELVNYAKTAEDLAECILEPEKHRAQDNEKKEGMLKQFMFLPDGKASERAEAEIIRVIKSN